MDIYEERWKKINMIQQLYDNRNTQGNIAEKFKMNATDVGKVTRKLGYSHTRHINNNNSKPGEKRDLLIRLNEFSYLDKYNVINFK